MEGVCGAHPDNQISARQWADEMAERFVCSIKNRHLIEVSIPKHWMIPDFADKVLSYCTEKGVEYTKIKETKNQVFVTHGRPQPPKKRPILIIIHRALQRTGCDAGEDILLHALDGSYIVYEGFDVATMRDQTRQAFDRGKKMAVILDWYKDIEILRDIVTEYNAIVLDAQCRLGRR